MLSTAEDTEVLAEERRDCFLGVLCEKSSAALCGEI